MSEDDLMLLALDSGAEDFEAEEEVYQITTAPEDFSSVRDGRKPVPLCSDVRICTVADEAEGAVQQT